MDSVDSTLPGGHAPAHWYDTWDRQTSQSFSNAAKGLRNAPGENNCFLNSAVQVFWHIDVFRRSYRRLSGHLCMGQSCIFCALKVIFTQFQYSDQASLQPSALRKALANTFAKQERFQLGHMDDAAECFENILNRIHLHIANTYNEDACTAPHCIPHQKFAMTVFDQLVCPCGASSEPHKFHEMVHYISANALVSQSRTMQESGDVLHPNRFGILLRNAGAVGDIRDCPGNCGKRVQIRRTLLSVPDVVSIGLVWGSDKADPELTAEVTRTIGTTILFPDMFHSVMCNDASQLPRLMLTSVVCYYGKHYSTFIFHTKLQEWVYFDDATVRQVGNRWEQVVERIVRSRYQPLLLIYTNPNAQPVPTETAPSTRVMAPGYSMTPAKNQEEIKGQPILPEKTQTGSQRSRSLTPNFDKTEGGQSSENREKESLERTSSFEHRRQSSFMLAVTRQKNKEEAIYAVPHNNTKVMNSQRDISQVDPRAGYQKQNSGTHLADIPDGPEDPDSYNYTLSNSDQYRRPGMNVSDPNRIPLTQNFSRTNEQQRKDSFKKGKGKVQADVIRYHVDGSRRSSQSSESDCNFPASDPPPGPTVSHNKPALPAKPKNIQNRSHSVDENMSDNSVNTSSHKVVKPLPTSGPFEPRDAVTQAHTPVQSGLATLPRNKKTSNCGNSSVSSSSSSLSSVAHTQLAAGSQTMAANHYHPRETPPPPYNLHANHTIASGYQNCLTYQNVVENDLHTRQGSNSSILSSGTVVECPLSDSSSHNRQISTTSQDTLTDKPKEQKSKTKKREKDEKKKEKEEKKKEDSKHKKDEKKSKLKKDKVSKPSNADKPPQVPDKKPLDEGFSEDKFYIDRRMVESVLSAQKLQRSGSCVSQASNSSIDSDNFGRSKGLIPKDVTAEIPFDVASIDSHKDSGYASSDRNSSSSTGSITMNPYEQYFLSRSMIPPKTINQQALAENMRKFMDNSPGVSGLEYTQEKDLKSIVVNPSEHFYQNQIVGQCQQTNRNYPKPGIPMSAPKDIMSLPKAEREQYLMDVITGNSKQGHPAYTGPGQAPQLPPKVNQGQLHYEHGIHTSKSSPVLSGLGSEQQTFRNTENSSVQSPSFPNQMQGYSSNGVRAQEPYQQTHEGLPGDNEQFMSLCQKAEEYMDSCVLSETSEQYRDALGYCQQAVDHLKLAMRMPNLGQSLYNMAQKKSNSCVIKYRSLQKRLMARQESNSSSTSSDSGINQDYRSRHGHFNQPKSIQVQAVGVKPPSRSSSQNSMDSLGSGRSSTPVFDKVMRPSTDERVPPVEPHMPPEYQNPYKDRSFETSVPDAASNPTDAYGTLPRWKTQKSQEHVRQCNNQYEAEVYNDFLENQRRQSGNHSRTSSGARTPVNEIDPGGYQGGYLQTTGQFDTRVNGEQFVSTGNRKFTEQGIGHQGLRPIPVVPPKLGNQSQHTESQPDLRKLSQEQVSLPQRPLTPQVLCPEPSDVPEERPVSVRALTSRFESAKISSDSTISDPRVKSVQNVSNSVHTSVGLVNIIPTESQELTRVALQRQRSKSESEFLSEQPPRPKSVLAKRCRNSDRTNKPRKSVTFSENICLVAAADQYGMMGNGDHVTGAGYQSDGEDSGNRIAAQGLFKKAEDTDSSTSDSPVEVIGEGACMLCHKQGVEVGQSYCAKCTFYMSRFTPR